MSIWNEYLKSTYDVVIVGGGFTGLNTAIHLKKANKKLDIVLLEKQPFGALASTNNAGFACFGSANEILSDLQNFPEVEVVELIRKRHQGISQLSKRNKIEANFYGGYDVFVPSEMNTYAEVEKNLSWINDVMIRAIGVDNVFSICNLTSMNMGFYEHGIKNSLEFQLNPGLLHQQLTDECMELGISILNRVEVEGYSTINDQIEVICHDWVFHCNQLAICTNALTPSIIPEAVVKPARGQIILTEPINCKIPQGNFHATVGFYYFRNVGNRMLLGGGRQLDIEGETTAEANVTNAIQEHLEQYMSQYVLPKKSYKISHRWAGIMGMGKSKKPEIKRLNNGIYVAYAFGGMGVALSNKSAIELSDLILSDR